MIIKAVLIEDAIPSSCHDCEMSFYEDMDYYLDYCVLTRKFVGEFQDKRIRPDWCPLVSRKHLENIIVNPTYDNAWDLINDILNSLGDENEV